MHIWNQDQDQDQDQDQPYSMSDSMRSSSCSRQGLQNLIRLTAQRSLEDAEEAERERRRRARGAAPPPPHTLWEEELKPSGRLVLEEDEGFSDWSHKLENRREQEVQESCRVRENRPATHRWKPDPEEEKEEEKEESSRFQEASGRLPEKVRRLTDPYCCYNVRQEEGSDVIQLDGLPRQQPASRQDVLPDGRDHEATEENRRRSEEETNQSRSSTLSLCSPEGEEPLSCFGPMSPTFKKLLIQFYPDEVESRVSADGTCTITERTESLRKSTGSIKKIPPPVAVSKIDNRLEQYTQAIQISSKEAKAGRQALPELPSPTEPLATKKNLFEAGEAWNQNSIKVAPSKDAEGLKVGVAELISQWVKGSPDGSRNGSVSKPAEIKPGEVLNKKNLWENLGDTFCPGGEGKGSLSGKRYKFVVTGHGKYEKVPVDDDDGFGENTNYQSAGQFHEDL
uniref:lymphocyte-specific protein 1-like n=1 Tax=Centroberyx gerrardi TaxID=166262 RepID=UPI003AAE2F93